MRDLTSLELNRRQDQLENLSRKCGTVREQLTERGPVSGAVTRSQLLADLGTSSWGDSPQETNKRVVPNRTGVREDDRSVRQTETSSELQSYHLQNIWCGDC